MAEPTPSLGFVGLGVMGLRMATNLGIKMPDSPLHIYDLSQEATAALKAKVPSVRVCSNSREVAEKAVSMSGAHHSYLRKKLMALQRISSSRSYRKAHMSVLSI